MAKPRRVVSAIDDAKSGGYFVDGFILESLVGRQVILRLQ